MKQPYCDMPVGTRFRVETSDILTWEKTSMTDDFCHLVEAPKTYGELPAKSEVPHDCQIEFVVVDSASG